MTTLSARPVENPDQLALFADEWTVTRKPLADCFREVCRAEAERHDGWVNPNNVRAAVLEAMTAGLLIDADGAVLAEINHRQYSALWSTACARSGYLDKTDVEVPINGAHSTGNSNKNVRLRRWRGWSA